VSVVEAHVPLRIRRAAWTHPEWAVALVALSSWAVLVLVHDAGPIDAHAAGATAGAHVHTMNGMLEPTSAHPAVPWTVRQGVWMLMTAAMMLPSSLPTVRLLAMNSLWRRRLRAGLTFVVALLGVWFVFGLILISVATAFRVPAGNDLVVGTVLLVAAGWELTQAKRRSLRACHRTVPLPPCGWRATRGCARFGIQYGLACVGACWALMLPMALAGAHRLFLMLLLTAVVVAEEGLERGTRLTRVAAPVLVGATIVMLVG
jgi:predicted metal-binding membrane protein